MQVYAVYYEASGQFLLGKKFTKGYFFYDYLKAEGNLVSKGKNLNGSGKYALPGGKHKEPESIADAARREFTEETAAQINEISTQEKLFSQQYSAVFFCVEVEEFNNAAEQIIKTNLPEGCKAQQDVIDQKIKQYTEIGQKYPHAPKDNELSQAYIWNVNNQEHWDTISKWRDDPVIGWYYDILNYLKNTILLS